MNLNPEQRFERQGRIRQAVFRRELPRRLPKLIPGTRYYHPPFNEEMRSEIVPIQAALNGVYPCTLDEWEHNLRMDLFLMDEIAWWRDLSDEFTAAIAGQELTDEERKRVYHKLIRKRFQD